MCRTARITPYADGSVGMGLSVGSRVLITTRGRRSPGWPLFLRDVRAWDGW